ncbi:MAG: PorT family protein [Tannerellaceae bacterium]|nr:PorT family protein [Tannerellaceae bacterium]
MKKIVCLFVLLATFSLSAQEFHVIPKVGLNLSTMTNGGDVKGGMNIGVSGEIMMNQAVAFEPGLYFSMQGAKADVGLSNKATLKTNYINIPLLVKGYVYDGFHLFAGPQVGILASSKAKIKEGGSSYSENADDALKTMNLDLVLGLGYLFDSGLSISFNYNIGLTNVSDIDDGKTRHMVAQFNVGWRF